MKWYEKQMPKAELAFFMTPGAFFPILASVAEALGTPLVFLRAGVQNGEPGIYLPPARCDLAGFHRDGRFSEIFMTLGAVPRSPQDAEFTIKHQDEIVVIYPGQVIDGRIGLSRANAMIRKSRAVRVVRALEKAVAEVSNRGMEGIDRVYRDFYYGHDTQGLAYYTNPDLPHTRFHPVP